MAHAPQQKAQRGMAALGFRGIAVVLLLCLPVAQSLREGVCAGDAAARVAREGAHEQGAQRVVHLVHAVGRQGEVFVGDPVDGTVSVAAIDQRLAEQHFGEHQRSAEHIAGGGGGLAGGGLGREITRRALHRGGVRVGSAHAGGDAEVGDLGAQVAVEQDVGRFEVAVHHPGRVRHVQCIEHRQHQSQRLCCGHGAVFMQVPGQRLARDVLEHQSRLAVDHIGFKQRGNVRVREPRHVARFAQPGFHAGPGARAHRLHHLDGHLPVKPGIVRQPHRGVRALAQHLTQFVPAEVGCVHMAPVRFS